MNTSEKTLNLRGNLTDVSKGLVMGILNITPDSFYDGGNYFSQDKAAERLQKMISEGADIIDIGAMSSRPGAKIISLGEEWERLKPILSMIKNDFPDLIYSVDTFRSWIAERAYCDYGAALVNDIFAWEQDEKMLEIIAKYNIPYIIMHNRGLPENMQQMTKYNNIVQDIINYFAEKVKLLNEKGVSDVIIDPGFGFAKTIEQNFFLLKNLYKFKVFDNIILAGLSRKSMAWKTLQITPEESLDATQTLNTIALSNGAGILRVHDVKPAKQLLKIYQKISESES